VRICGRSATYTHVVCAFVVVVQLQLRSENAICTIPNLHVYLPRAVRLFRRMCRHQAVLKMLSESKKMLETKMTEARDSERSAINANLGWSCFGVLLISLSVFLNPPCTVAPSHVSPRCELRLKLPFLGEHLSSVDTHHVATAWRGPFHDLLATFRRTAVVRTILCADAVCECGVRTLCADVRMLCADVVCEYQSGS
jgi:hypothetical protein